MNDQQLVALMAAILFGDTLSPSQKGSTMADETVKWRAEYSVKIAGIILDKVKERHV